MKVWVNGKFFERDEARISVFDAGLQHGVGLFETMHARNGEVHRLARHLTRLEASAKELRLIDALHLGPLAEAVEMTLKENGLTEARIRLTLTGGDLNLLQTQHVAPIEPTIIIEAQAPTQYPDRMFTEGVPAAISDSRMNPLDPMAGHKTLNYWPRLFALQEAGGRGAGEAIWFSVTNHVMSGSVSNLFIVNDNVLLTPFARGEETEGALASPVLPGITRELVIDWADEAGAECRREMIDIDTLLEADEVFLTNSSWGILPIVAIESETIGTGEPGSITKSLRAKWVAEMDELGASEAADGSA